MKNWDWVKFKFGIRNFENLWFGRIYFENLDMSVYCIFELVFFYIFLFLEIVFLVEIGVLLWIVKLKYDEMK